MTVITKAIGDKRTDKMEQPLFVEDNATEDTKGDPEAQVPKKVVKQRYLVTFSRRSIPSINITATFSLLLIGLLILMTGIVGGLCIYKQFAKTQMHRFRTGWYSIPYDNSNRAPCNNSALADSELFKSLARGSEQDAMDAEKNVDSDNRKNNFFKERFELDLDNQHYDIDVPDFQGRRQGRFIHDFSLNKTGIIDTVRQCCFVMPLNRQRILPPRNMYDLLRKMYSGYYEVDTKIVQETMKVVLPPITDLSLVGTYIARECRDLPKYMLTKANSSSSNVFKRSISNGIYGLYAGMNIIELNILNIDDIEEYNKSSKN
ncbi:integral membrane protein 2A [Halictus rubicundus]|uniref:integral membrane protein 2A n=1 Tax=Halictus rubicundus TaxID=77578 RepID=UPI0040353B30